MTREDSLTATIRLGSVGTNVALLAGIRRVHQDHGDTSQHRLVLDERTQLCKGPARHSGALRALKPRPSADVLEVFQRNTAHGALGDRNECLADTVIDITAKPRFPVCQTLEGTSDGLGPFPALLTGRRSLLQPLSALGITRAAGFNLLSAMCCAIARRGEIDHTQVDAKKVCRREERAIRDLDDDEQEPLLLIPQHQMTLPGAWASKRSR